MFNNPIVKYYSLKAANFLIITVSHNMHTISLLVNKYKKADALFIRSKQINE